MGRSTLIQKILTVLQRNFHDEEKLGQKRLTDFSFSCTVDGLPDPQVILKDFLI